MKRPVKKGSRPGKKEAMIPHLDPGDNRKYTLHSMEVANLSVEELDLTSAEAVTERCNDYFTLCNQNDMKPNVAGFALALGIDRQSYYDWLNGTSNIPETARKIIKRYHTILNTQMEDYMQNGKINPVAGIFIMKNNMGYEDKKEVAVAPVNPLGEEKPSEELRRKYLAAVETDNDKKIIDI